MPPHPRLDNTRAADSRAAPDRRARSDNRGIVARLFSQNIGTAAVEFGLVGPIFVVFALFIFELALDFVTQELMDTAARDAARLIRIGTITGSGYSSTLTTDVCNDLPLVPSCSTSIQIYVAAAASGSPAGHAFTTLSLATISSGVMTTTQASLASNYDVILQIGYQRTWMIQWVADVLGTTGGFLISTIAFQTEPY